MPMLCALVAAALAQGPAPIAIRPPSPRFETVAPFPALPWVRVDDGAASVGVAQKLARAKGLQGRVLWVDGTANLGRINSDEKVASLLAMVAEVGFNTVVLDVKPIVGRTLYPSSLTPQLTRWREATMPEGYDPLAAFCREAKRNGLSLLISMNAFSEGHSYAKRDEGKPDTPFGDPGWGYRHPELQTVQLESRPELRVRGKSFPVSPTLEPNPKGLGEEIGLFRAPLRDPEFVVAPLDASGRVAKTAPTVFAAARRGSSAGQALGALGVGGRVEIGSTSSFVPIGRSQRQIPLMMNPLHPEVQSRALGFVREVMGRYAVDGMLYDDRLRFGGLDADFSELSRAAFQRWVGRPVRWPDDVFRFTYTLRMERGVSPGPLYDAWMAWRALAMRNWVRRVRAEVRKARPSALFGIYGGSWYGDYPRFGSNYGSERLVAGYPFLTRTYRQTGFASDLDLFISGCYYPVATVVDAMEQAKPLGRTVEAAAVTATRAVRDECWSYSGIMLSDYAGNPDALARALQAAACGAQGVMVFDLSHATTEQWNVLRRAFRSPAKPPHATPDLLDQVRKRRHALDSSGYREPAVPFYEGAPGAGF